MAAHPERLFEAEPVNRVRVPAIDCRAERHRATIRLLVTSLAGRREGGSALDLILDGSLFHGVGAGRSVSMSYTSHAVTGPGTTPIRWCIEGTSTGRSAKAALEDATWLGSHIRSVLGSHTLAPGLSAEPPVRGRPVDFSGPVRTLRAPSVHLTAGARGQPGFQSSVGGASRASVAIALSAASSVLDRTIALLAQASAPTTLRVSLTPVQLTQADRGRLERLLEQLERGGEINASFGPDPFRADPAFIDHALRTLRAWVGDGAGWRRTVTLSCFDAHSARLISAVARQELFGSRRQCVRASAGTLDLSDLIHVSDASALAVPAQHRLAACGVRLVPPVPSGLGRTGIRLGQAVSGDHAAPVHVAPSDLDRHMLIVGASGTGKSVLVHRLAREAMDRGEGLCLLDPHGDLYAGVLADVPKHRAADVVCIEPGDSDRAVGLNLLQGRTSDLESDMNQAANDLMEIFDALFDLHITGGPMFDTYMRHAIHLVGHNSAPGTLASVVWLFEDDEYRQALLKTCLSPHVVNFWKGIAERGFGETSMRSMAPYVVSKLGRFTANPVLRSMLSQPESTVDFDRVVADRRILLVNLSVGALGVLDARLLGMLVLSRLYAGVMRRDGNVRATSPFTICIDEAQHFATPRLGQLAAESRKYGCRLVLATQALAQLQPPRTPHLRDTILGNVSSLMVFRPGVADAALLEPYLAPEIGARDLLDLPNFEAAVRLLTCGAPLRPFTLRTDPPEPSRSDADAAAIIAAGRDRYTRLRSDVESALLVSRGAFDQ